MTSTETDCRTKSGVDVGLIDSIITAARVLGERQPDTSDQAVKEALLDLHNDEDVKLLLALANNVFLDDYLAKCSCGHSKMMHGTAKGSCASGKCKCKKFEVASSNGG